MTALNNRIPPPLVMIVAAIVMWIVAHFTYRLHLSLSVRIALVILFAAIALCNGPPAVMMFRRNRTTIDPVRIDRASSLVTSGPFSHSRNPMYVAMLALLFAWACWLAAPWAVLGPILFELYILRFQIWPEERAMHAKFGDAYVDYTRRVRRWI